MSRGICTVFVALAIFQGAVAINVEPNSVINLVMTNRTSRSIKLFDDEDASGFIGDVTIGNRSEHYEYSVKDDYFGNGLNDTVYAVINISYAEGTKIHYFKAANRLDSTVAFCADESSLGSNWILVNARYPTNLSIASFTVGLEIPKSTENSSSVKAIQALLIPFTVITLLLINFHL